MREAAGSTPGLEAGCRRAALAGAGLAAGIAALGFSGYVLGISKLASFTGGSIPMAPASAACFWASAFLIFLQVKGPGARRLAPLAKPVLLGLTLVAALVLGQAVLTQADGVPGSIPLWKMSSLTALLFLLVAWRLWRFGSDADGEDALGTALSVTVLAASAVLALGYAQGQPFFYSGSTIPPALPTVLAFGAVAIGLLAADPQAVAASALVDDSPRGILLRGFLPFTVFAGFFYVGLRQVALRWTQHPVATQWAPAAVTLMLAVYVTYRLSDRVSLRILEAQEDLRRLEEKMRQGQKMEALGLLAGGIAHDFNNLLTVIMGNVDLTRSALPEGEPAKEQLDAAEAAAKQAAELCQQMLDYAGMGRAVTGSAYLDEVVGSIEGVLKSSVGKKAPLVFEHARRVPPVKVDKSQIRQVVLNLVINAAEAMEGREGRVVLATGCSDLLAQDLQSPWAEEPLPAGRYCWLEVADHGVGMDEKTLLRVFDPFFSTKFTGRGLGLAAVLGIVRGHGGIIKAASRPGQGTTFTVLLPAEPGPSRG